MKVKKLDREQTLKLIDELKERIAFNNLLNASVRKFMKEHDPNKTFNGFHDAPTQEMIEHLKSLLESSNLDVALQSIYMNYCGEIFGQVYGPHVNSYVLRDLHDCEKHLQEIELATNNRQEENDWFRVERDLSTNRMNLYFDGIPEPEVRDLLKKNGFKWAGSYYKCWTRLLNANAEKSLKKIKEVLHI